MAWRFIIEHVLDTESRESGGAKCVDLWAQGDWAWGSLGIMPSHMTEDGLRCRAMCLRALTNLGRAWSRVGPDHPRHHFLLLKLKFVDA